MVKEEEEDAGRVTEEEAAAGLDEGVEEEDVCTGKEEKVEEEVDSFSSFSFAASSVSFFGVLFPFTDSFSSFPFAGSLPSFFHSSFPFVTTTGKSEEGEAEEEEDFGARVENVGE